MQVLISEEYLQDVGEAIREKNGLETTYLPNEFGVAIRALPTDGATPLDTLTATENGEYTPQAGYGGFSKVTVRTKANSYSASASGASYPHRNITTMFTLNYVWSTEAQSVN